MNKSLCFLVVGLLILFQIGCGKKTRTGAEQSLGKIEKIDYSKLKTQVEAFNRATVAKDFNKVIDWTYPKYIEQAGGREQILNAIKTGVEDYKAQGIETMAISIGQPGEVVQIKDQLFSVVPTTSTLKAPGGTLVGEITVLAVSSDGTNWKFISNLNQERFDGLFPEAAGTIIIPDVKEATFVEGE
jgi:hypothetical protein